MVKKYAITVALILSMSLGVCGCSDGTDNTTSSPSSENSPTSATEQPTSTPTSSSSRKEFKDEDVDISNTTSKGRYCFEKLNDNEKLYYEKIRKAVESHYWGLFWNNRDCSKETAEKLVKYVAYDYPEYFWYSDKSGGVDMMTDKLIKRITIHNNYTEDDKGKIQPELEKAVQTYTDSAKDLKSDYEKALNAYEYIIKNTEYVADGGATLDSLQDVESDKTMLALWNMTGVFVDKKASDRGYAQAFEYLMQQAGIECSYVQGADNGFWNVVKLDGEWYCVDVGAGDSTDAEIDYSYFAITSEQMATVHKTDTENFVAELPECTATADNYFVKNPSTKETNHFA